ncbi:MAG: discoidin domain-containing protein [Gemmatimonadales bacterium]
MQTDDPSVAWHSAGDGAQRLELDFGGARQLGGLVLDWSTTDWPMDYDVEAADDSGAWTVRRAVRGGAGGRRFVHLPALETSRLRLVLRRSSRGAGYALRALHLLADSAAGTRTAFLERVAQGSPRGDWPRSLMAQQSYWTVVGIPRDARDAAFSEDGSVESHPGSFSLEPFLFDAGTLLTWANATTSHSLDDGTLPIPTARRVSDDLELASTSFATGTPGHSVIWIRYRVVNRRLVARTVQLFAAVRPVQVNPPWQFLGTPGGAASVHRLRWNGDALVVNDTDLVVAVTRPTHVGLSTFDAGSVVERMRGGTLPPVGEVDDSTGFADGALSWTLALAPRDSADVLLALPVPGDELTPAANPLADSRAIWHRELGTVQIALPGTGARLAQTVQSALGYVLVNTRGRAIQPGTRSYRRSWIRDGALTSAALLRLGHFPDVGSFLDWFTPYVFADGKVPCCVDARGADPVTENDADGELLFLAAEYWRFTGDTATIARHWPTLKRVAAHLDSLRQSRRTERYRASDSLFVFGLLPPSISHEGYSAKPAYSYWDDWWGVRGLDDAGTLATVVHDSATAARYRAAGAEMRREVVVSISASMQLHHLATLPGAAELGDLDPTSSTIALEPAQALADLPRAAVTATFDSAWSTLSRRIAEPTSWDVYTPYEWRDVGSFIRLGEPARAQAYAEWLMTTQRPAGWNEWSEAVWRDPRAAKFIGDMPHGWVLSDFVRSVLDMIAYERESDSTLVVGAGIPIAWARDSAGVTVRHLRTWWGPLDLRVRRAGAAVRVTIDGVHPPNGIELRAPYGRVPRGVLVNGIRAVTIDEGRAVKLAGPAVVEFRY